MQISDENLTTLKVMLEAQLGRPLPYDELAVAGMSIVRFVLVSELKSNLNKGKQDEKAINQ